MGFIQDLADAIARQEGFSPGTRAYRNNNPGNLWDGAWPGKTHRIFPQYPIDDKGYVIFPDAQTGRSALERDLSIKVARGQTLRQLITQYAPPHENPTEQYISNVSTWLNIRDDRRLSDFIATWPASPEPTMGPAGPPDSTVATSPPPPGQGRAPSPGRRTLGQKLMGLLRLVKSLCWSGFSRLLWAFTF